MTSEWGQANEPFGNPFGCPHSFVSFWVFEIGSLEALAKPGAFPARHSFRGTQFQPLKVARNQILFVNNGDAEGDGVPNFADGYNVSGVFTNEGANAGGALYPLRIKLAHPIDVASAKIKLTFSESRPDQVTRADNGDGTHTYTSGPGLIRIWKKAGSDSRDGATDAMHTGQEYVCGTLGYSTEYTVGDSTGGRRMEGNETVTFWVEAVKASTTPGEIRIRVDIDPDGIGPAGYWGYDEVTAMAIETRLVKIKPGNQTEPATTVEASYSTPVITLSTVSLTNIGASVPDYSRILGTLNIAGGITSEACDLYPDAAVSEVQVFVNSQDTPSATLPVFGSHGNTPSSFLHPFPYSASFAESFEVKLELGENLIRVAAIDNVLGIVGYTEWTVEVTGEYHPTFSLQYVPVTYSSGTLPDSISAQISTPDQAAVSATLTSTAGNLNTFSAYVGPPSFTGPTIAAKAGLSGIFKIIFDSLPSVDDAVLDLYSGRVTCESLALTNEEAVLVESSASSRNFSHDGSLLPTWLNWTFNGTSAVERQSSTSDPVHVHGVEIAGPESVLDRIGNVAIEESQNPDRWRRLIKSGDGKRLVGSLYTSHVVPAALLFSPFRNVSAVIVRIRQNQGNNDDAEYAAGFTTGFLRGGWSLVEGTAQTYANYGPHFYGMYRWGNGENFTEVKNILTSGLQLTGAIGGFYGDWRGRQLAEVYYAPDPGDALVKQLSQDGYLVAELCKEFIIFLGQQTGGSAYEAGKIQGRVAFEVASLFIAQAKAGQLKNLTKLKFLSQLETRLETATFEGAQGARAAAAAAKEVASNPAAQGGTEFVQRAMSRKELRAIRDNGVLSRGGRGGPHHVSDSVNSNRYRARQRLALPGTPEVRATLEVPAGVFSPPTVVPPNYRMPGGGLQRTAPGHVDIPVRVIDVLEY